MPDLREGFEALMPEPVGHTYIGGDGPRHQWNEAIMDVLPIFPQRTKLYTEEQLRSAMQEVWNTATERAAKKEREECAKTCEDRATAYRSTRAPGWHEVDHECTQCAAAIRAREGKGATG